MFENISFMFSLALAFTAWVVLCYLHVIEQQTLINNNEEHEYGVLELYNERPTNAAPQHYKKNKAMYNDNRSGSDSSYGLLASFALIFIGTMTLSKLLHFLELRARRYVQVEQLQPNVVPTPNEINSTIDQLYEDALDFSVTNEQNDSVTLCHQENAELRKQLNALEARCIEMHQMLAELHQQSSDDIDSISYASMSRRTSSSNLGDVSMTVLKTPVAISVSDSTLLATNTLIGEQARSIPQPTPPTPPTHNVYITNSHIHINGKIFIGEHNINMDLHRQAKLYTHQQSEFLQVWSTFIRGPKERPMLAGIRCNNFIM